MSLTFVHIILELFITIGTRMVTINLYYIFIYIYIVFNYQYICK